MGRVPDWSRYRPVSSRFVTIVDAIVLARFLYSFYDAGLCDAGEVPITKGAAVTRENKDPLMLKR